jgi:glutamate-5-semialdehyde dehydrogenase
MRDVAQQLKKVKQASRTLSSLTEEKRNQVLVTLSQLLREHSAQIIEANQKDLAGMDEKCPKYARLGLSEQQIGALADDLLRVVALEQPTGKVLEEKSMPNGLKIQKVAVPLGVVAVIYEARPNVTVDVFALCFKAGNAVVLKGGKEAQHSNAYLASLIHQALHAHELAKEVAVLLPPERELLYGLLNAVGLVDVCIPRGSQALIEFVRDQAKIPVIETGAGIVHTYFDQSADLERARPVLLNAKTRRVSVCNALDTLIIHQQRLNELPSLVAPLALKDVELFADDLSYDALVSFYPQNLLHKAQESDFGVEFLDYKMSIKTVDCVEAAVQHIMHFTSGHSEAILAEDQKTIDYFLEQVDAAALYVNTSTAFTDGGQFGMGAEIGISTQKLHARGPMGLQALTSYKWIVYGQGQIRAE